MHGVARDVESGLEDGLPGWWIASASVHWRLVLLEGKHCFPITIGTALCDSYFRESPKEYDKNTQILSFKPFLGICVASLLLPSGLYAYLPCYKFL